MRSTLQLSRADYDRLCGIAPGLMDAVRNRAAGTVHIGPLYVDFYGVPADLARRVAAILNPRPRNFRFWDYVQGGYVKLTLSPGQTLRWSRRYHNGEGWTHEGEDWTLSPDGLTVENRGGSTGTDCDGRHSHHFTAEFHTRDGQLVPAYAAPGLFRPDWQQVSAGQRDHSAERAGY